MRDASVNGLIVTSVTIVDPRTDENPLIIAWIQFTLNDCVKISGARLITLQDGRIILAWPQRKLQDGSHVPVAHPLNNRTRLSIQRAVLAAYREHCWTRETVPCPPARYVLVGESVRRESFVYDLQEGQR